MVALPVRDWTPPIPNRDDLSRDTKRTYSFPGAGKNYASETGQADRRYRAVYELFNYFYRN